MPRSISELVADNFSKDPEYYDGSARAQMEVAERLAATIHSAGSPHRPKRVLEIGCGTGFLTKRLFGLFPSSEFVVTDISPAMLEFCRGATADIRLGKGIAAEFALDDIAETKLSGGFDLIASSFAFQWAGRLCELTPVLARLSRNGGIVCFSVLCENTFGGVQNYFSEHGVSFPVPHLASDVELDRALSVFSRAESLRFEIREDYPSLRAFLRHIQRVGAVNASGKRVETATLKRLLAEGNDFPLTVEYDVAIAICEV